MLVDPGPFVKFWWKGVDVVADVLKSLLTAAIVATVAYLTWEQKKRREHKLELEHERNKKIQEESLSREFAAERARQERTASREARISRWHTELAALFKRFPTIEEYGTLTLFARYREWLEASGLIAFGHNLEIAKRWSGRSGLSDKDVLKLREQIEATELPKVDDDTFLW